jgi:hypothetical protein
MSGITLEGYILEVYDFKDLISWCIDKFEKNKKIIQLQGEYSISLAPLVFKRIIRVTESRINFKGIEAQEVLKIKKMEDWRFYENILKTQKLFQRTFEAFN